MAENEDQKGIPSSLDRRRRPIRGVGAAYAQNQRLAGADDPETAARIATLSSEGMRRAEQASQKLSRMLGDLSEARQTGEWAPDFDLKDDPNLIESAHRKLLQFRRERADAEIEGRLPEDTPSADHQGSASVSDGSDYEDEARAASLFASAARVSPEDLNYNALQDRERRLRIEARCAPLGQDDYEDLLFKNHIEQQVPVSGRLTLTLRSLTSDQSRWLEGLAAQQDFSSEMEMRHWFGLAQLAIALRGLNGTPLQPILDVALSREDFMPVFGQRMKVIGKMAQPLTDDFIVQFQWFMGRVRKLIVEDDLTEMVGNS